MTDVSCSPFDSNTDFFFNRGSKYSLLNYNGSLKKQSSHCGTNNEINNWIKQNYGQHLAQVTLDYSHLLFQKCNDLASATRTTDMLSTFKKFLKTQVFHEYFLAKKVWIPGMHSLCTTHSLSTLHFSLIFICTHSYWYCSSMTLYCTAVTVLIRSRVVLF